MPPVTQSQRTGLIVGVAVMTLLFIVSFVFAVYFAVQLNNAQDELADKQDQYGKVVASGELTSPLMQQMRDVQEATGTRGSLLSAANQMRSQLATLVVGSDATFAAVRDQGTQALAQANADLQNTGVTVPNHLAGAVQALTAAVVAKDKQVANLTTQLEASKQDLARKIEEHNGVLAARDQQVEQVRMEAEEAITIAAEDRTAKQTQLEELQEQWGTQEAQFYDVINQRDVQLRERDDSIQQLQGQVASVNQRLSGLRVDAKQQPVRQPDGRIVRVPDNTNTVYVNLGQGDQITPGLTFEVYDKLDGIPKLADNNDEDAPVPVGKASIEVTRVGATSSEARVIRKSPNVVIAEGDLLVNLVYDKNTKYNFVVFGNFDMDQNGVATPGDAEIIQRLITQWGGNIVDRVNVDTDFVVLGKEPEVPYFTPEELQDAFNVKKQQDAEQAVEQYQQIVQRAAQLHVPILNQNRFLYFIGFYDQAAR